jgi:hypothetical protein
MLRVGDNLVPLIFMSGGTYHLIVAGDKTMWPVYMTIGNLSWKLRQMPSTHSIVLVALLLIAITPNTIPQTRLDLQQHTHREVLDEVLQSVLLPLTLK